MIRNDGAWKDVASTVISSSTQVQNRDKKIEENMIAHKHYLDLHSSKGYLKSLNNSSDTWEALENAEKLLQEASRKITESKCDVPWLDLTLNRTFSSDLDESDLNIRQRVITKLQEINKRKLSEKQNSSNKNNNIFSSENLQNKKKTSEKKTRIRNIYQSPVKVVETCRKCSEEKIRNKSPEKYKLKSFNQVNDWKVKTKPSTKAVNRGNNKINFKSQLPVRNVKKCRIISNSCHKLSTENVKTVKASVAQNESIERKKCDGILIDVAVQTSFKDQVIEETDSPPKNIGQNQSEKHIDRHETDQLETLNSPKKSEEKQDERQKIMNNDYKIETRNDDTSNKNHQLKGSFVKFLCQISPDIENPVEILPNSSKTFNALQTSDISENSLIDEEFYDELDVEEVNLNSPNLADLDKMLSSLDENLEKIIRDADKLEDLFTEAKSYNKHDKTANNTKNKRKMNDQQFVMDERSIDFHQQIDFTDESPKNEINFRTNHEKESSDSSEKNKTSDEIRFILEPRSRISSYESVSSEVFHQQAKVSTPLNNYRNIEATHHPNKKNVDTNYNEYEKKFISEQKGIVDVNVDAKNDTKNDVNVFITRNRLSSISCIEKNPRLIEEKLIDNKKEKNCDLKSTSVEKFNGKSPRSSYLKNSCIEEHIMSSNSAKHSSSSSQINSHRISINSNNEVAEKHHKEKSEKSFVQAEQSNKENIEDEIQKVEEENKLTSASSKNDTHNRTSFDISGIYSENFEESVTEPKSISKEHTDKSKSISLENETGEKNTNHIDYEISPQNESEKILSPKIKTTNIDLKINEISKSISSQVKIDENPSAKSFKSLLADNNEKSFEENCNSMKVDPPSAISTSRPSSQKSISNPISNQRNPEVANKGPSSSEDYSEGEVRSSDSYSYSFGEIRLPESQLAELTKNNEILLRDILHSSSGSFSLGEIRIPECMLKQLEKKNDFQMQSHGEILNTDIKSVSSIESFGEV